MPPQAAPLGTPIVTHLSLSTIESNLGRLRPKTVDAHMCDNPPHLPDRHSRNC